MSLGLLASAAGIVKVVLLSRMGLLKDAHRMVDPFIWTNIEACLGLMAASIPVLKAPFERILARLGFLPSTQSDTHPAEWGRRTVIAGNFSKPIIIEDQAPYWAGSRGGSVSMEPIIDFRDSRRLDMS
jgi:hypothetical protein